MSINIRYLTNGHKAVYVVQNSGVSPVEIKYYDNRDAIPENIRHYVPTNEPVLVGPDASRMFNVKPILYPNFPDCKHPDYLGKVCIAESCNFAKPTYKDCPYFDKNYEVE